MSGKVAELKAQEIQKSEMMVDELRELSSKAESKIIEVEAARRADEVRNLLHVSCVSRAPSFCCPPTRKRPVFVQM